MKPAYYDLNIIEGAGIDGNFTYLDSDSNPINLTGYTARAQFKVNRRSPEAYIDLTTENGGIVLGAALGTIKLVLSEEQYTDIQITGGVWQLELYPGGSFPPIRLLQGNVFVDKEVITDD